MSPCSEHWFNFNYTWPVWPQQAFQEFGTTVLNLCITMAAWRRLCTNVWLFKSSQTWQAASVHFWRKRKKAPSRPSPPLSWWRKRDESFIHPSLPPLCILWRAVWETEKSGVEEGVNVRGELEMTDNGGLKERMWQFKMRWRSASVTHQTPPASTSPPLFLWLLLLLLFPRLLPSPPLSCPLLSSLPCMIVLTSMGVLCMLHLYLENQHSISVRTWSRYTTQHVSIRRWFLAELQYQGSLSGDTGSVGRTSFPQHDLKRTSASHLRLLAFSFSSEDMFTFWENKRFEEKVALKIMTTPLIANLVINVWCL